MAPSPGDFRPEHAPAPRPGSCLLLQCLDDLRLGLGLVGRPKHLVGDRHLCQHRDELVSVAVDVEAGPLILLLKDRLDLVAPGADTALQLALDLGRGSLGQQLLHVPTDEHLVALLLLLLLLRQGQEPPLLRLVLAQHASDLGVPIHGALPLEKAREEGDHANRVGQRPRRHLSLCRMSPHTPGSAPNQKGPGADDKASRSSAKCCGPAQQVPCLLLPPWPLPCPPRSLRRRRSRAHRRHLLLHHSLQERRGLRLETVTTNPEEIVRQEGRAGKEALQLPKRMLPTVVSKAAANVVILVLFGCRLCRGKATGGTPSGCPCSPLCLLALLQLLQWGRAGRSSPTAPTNSHSHFHTHREVLVLEVPEPKGQPAVRVDHLEGQELGQRVEEHRCAQGVLGLQQGTGNGSRWRPQVALWCSLALLPG